MSSLDTRPAAEILVQAPLAPLWPRFGAIVYESVLLFGITFISSWVFVTTLGDATHGMMRFVFRGYLFVVLGVYFVFCWRRTGQTLAMKTWGLRLRGADGLPIALPAAVARYTLAVAGATCAGAGFVWAFVDRDRQFLHDRLLGTRIVRAPI